MVLQELFCPSGYTTVTYLPVLLVKDIAIYDSDEEKLDEELDDNQSLYFLSLIKFNPYLLSPCNRHISLDDSLCLAPKCSRDIVHILHISPKVTRTFSKTEAQK